MIFRRILANTGRSGSSKVVLEINDRLFRAQSGSAAFKIGVGETEIDFVLESDLFGKLLPVDEIRGEEIRRPVLYTVFN